MKPLQFSEARYVETLRTASCRRSMRDCGGSFNQVRIVLVMDAGWTSPLVKVQSLSSCVPLVKSLLLLDPLGHA
jgi:hypothetical protein